MLDSQTKSKAYATMDDAASFRFEVVPAEAAPATQPGEDAQRLIEAPSVAEMKQPVKMLRHMARTFFGEKLTGVAKPPDTDGPVVLYLISELAELDGAYIDILSEEGDAPSLPPEAGAAVPLSAAATMPLPGHGPVGADTIKLSDQDTIELAADEDWD